jgi:hypothetical protein
VQAHEGVCAMLANVLGVEEKQRAAPQHAAEETHEAAWVHGGVRVSGLPRVIMSVVECSKKVWHADANATRTHAHGSGTRSSWQSAREGQWRAGRDGRGASSFAPWPTLHRGGPRSRQTRLHCACN